MSTSTPDLFTTLRNGWVDAVQQWTDASQSLWDEIAAPFTGDGSAPSGSAWTPWPAWGKQRSRPAHDHEHHHHGPHHDERHDHDHDHRHDHRHADPDPKGHGKGHDGWSCGCGCGGTRSGGCVERGEAHGSSTCRCGGACSCCVPDADVVVHTRVGERRIVPLALHNSWRRERPVTLAVGPWHVSSDTDLAVVAVLEEEQLTLAPCEDRIVRLVLGITTTTGDGGGKPGDGNGGNGAAGGTEDSTEDGTDANGPGVGKGGSDVHLDTHVGMGQGRMPGDLDACASAYADVRFEGCSRPLRVAVVVSPTPCHPVEAGCDCGCW